MINFLRRKRACATVAEPIDTGRQIMDRYYEMQRKCRKASHYLSRPNIIELLESNPNSRAEIINSFMEAIFMSEMGYFTPVRLDDGNLFYFNIDIEV